MTSPSYRCSMGEAELLEILARVGEVWRPAGIAFDWSMGALQVSDAALESAFRNDVAHPLLTSRLPTCVQLQATQGYVSQRINVFVVDRMATVGPQPRTAFARCHFDGFVTSILMFFEPSVEQAIHSFQR